MNLLSQFAGGYKITQQVEEDRINSILPVPSELENGEFEEFIRTYSGATFNDGIYRIHEIRAINKWNGIVGHFFPQHSAYIYCFGYDWMGRQFVLDINRKEAGKPGILLMDIDTGEVLKIPANLISFHENELINHPEEALARDSFIKWKQQAKHLLKHNECVGFKQPLFLGGSDTLDNREQIDMEVYWAVTGQIFEKTRNLPSGTKIDSVRIG